MDTVGKLIAAALLCSVICLLLKKQAAGADALPVRAGMRARFLTSFPFFSPILAFFHRLQELTSLSGAVFAPLFKTAAIGLLAQMAATICRDSGQQALAQAVEICCGFISFYLALPLLEMVLTLLKTMIGG